MFSVSIVTLVFVYITTGYGQSCINDTFKIEVWHNLTEFLNAGWYPYRDSHSFEKPSLLNQSLSFLDADSSWGIWTNLEHGELIDFTLNVTERPEYKGMTEATIIFKYFSTDYEFPFTPCVNPYSASPYCVLNNSDSSWSTVELSINITLLNEIEEMHFGGEWGWKLMDEVSLIHNGGSCRDYCNVTCEYAAIDCHNYYSCVNFTKQYYNCSEELGLAFNPQLGVCDFIDNVEGCGKVSCGCEYRPHQNCSSYYFCEDSCLEDSCEVRICPDGLVWNKDSAGHQQCTLPQFSSFNNCTRMDMV